MSRKHFTLQGNRSLSHRVLARLLERGEVIAWARPGQEPIVVLTAEQYEELSGHAVPETTFAPSRFCRLCTRFTGGRDCIACDPPSCESPRFDNEGNVLSVDHSTETALIDPALRNNAHLAPKESEELTLQNIKAAYELLKPYQENAINEALDAREAAIKELSSTPPFIPWSFIAEAAKPVRVGQLVTIRDDGFVEPAVGVAIEPGDAVTFDITDGPTLPWLAPLYRALDADFRTLSEEWKQSVRGRDVRWIEGVLP